MRALVELTKCKGVFGAAAARRVSELLEQLLHARLTKPSDLIVLHETVLYLRAYPQSPRVMMLAEKILASFAARVRGKTMEELEDPEISGIAGTSVSSNFSHEFARSIVERHGPAVEIDWENYERADRLGPVLADLLPVAAEAWTVEPHVDWREWFKSTGCTLQWLVERVEPRLYDMLEIPIRWDLGDSAASRTKLCLPRRKIFYHNDLLRRRDISIEAEFRAPRLPVTQISKAAARRIANVMVDSSAARYRELWGFSHPDLDHFCHADFGRGVDFYFCGVPGDWRLPVRAYHSGMYFKNGIPLGYFEGLSLFERMEAGFNLYYTFREGETAWLYARTLKMFREQLGVTCFSIDPYQIGRENDEAIESGAFWFYTKLGFRPALPEAARLAAREEKKMAAMPEHRTSATTLRRLAESPMLYGGLPEGLHGGNDAWGRFSIQELAKRTDRRGESLWKNLNAPAIARAKNGPDEVHYLRLLQASPELRKKVLALGRV